MRKWTVAGGIIHDGEHLLLVENLRRNGRRDWSTPGGVVDPGESVLGALTREVREETGIEVESWERKLYEVDVIAHDMDWHMRAEIHLASAYAGDIFIDDPDGIVTQARWSTPAETLQLLAGGLAWLVEPLTDWLEHRWDTGVRSYGFDVTGAYPDGMSISRRELD
ncbi:MAG: NUDIX hydrolase [Acidimicrobiales bacterium]|nr:NUDIX hydrolase [Acidimicrobiales bacterium]